MPSPDDHISLNVGNCLQEALSLTNLGLAVLDTDGLIQDANTAFCTMVGDTVDRLRGQVFTDLLSPADQGTFDSLRREILDGTSTGFAGEARVCCKGGGIARIRLHAAAKPMDKGSIPWIALFAETVDNPTPTKAEQEAIHQKLRLHVECTPMAVIEWDPGFHVTQWNPAAEAIFGYTPDEAIGRHASFIIPEEARHLVDDVWNNLIQKKGGERSTNQNLRKDGKLILCEWYNTPLIDPDGTVTGAASLAMDMTERETAREEQAQLVSDLENRVAKRTSELRKAMETLIGRNATLRKMTTRLKEAEESERRRLANLLHDNYQQLLVAAKMKTELLENHIVSAEGGDARRDVVSILDDAIDACRTLTAGLSPPTLTESGLHASLQWMAHWMQENFKLCVTVLGPAGPYPLSEDSCRIVFNAVRELLFNVAKHAQSREACILISDSDQNLNITVSDQGIGFNISDKLENPCTFGLFNIQEQIAQIGGTLDIESTIGHGSTFRLSAPLSFEASIEEAGEEPHWTASFLYPALNDKGSIRILIADDHALVRQGFVELLSNQPGMEIVAEASDGMEAVRLCTALNPDIVLMDVTMPIKSGPDATRLIRKMAPATQVIGLSMHDEASTISLMMESGASAYLSKSTPIETLFHTIRNCPQTR